MKHLLVDDHAVQTTFNLRRRFHEPVKHPEPVLAPERPWEGNQTRVTTPPLWDADRRVWRLWYAGGPGLMPLYAESTDGIHWDRPALGRAAWEGEMQTNIVRGGKSPDGGRSRNDSDGPVPHSLMEVDEREPDPSRRFKGFAWFRSRDKPNKTHLLRPFYSANGFDWTRVPEADGIPSEDTKQFAIDRLHNRYLLMVKGLTGCGVTTYGAAELGRIVYLSTSENFVHWTAPELVFHADPIDQELGKQRIEAAIADPDRQGPVFVKPDQFFTDVYYLPVFIYEGLYLGLPMLFNQSGAYFFEGHSNQDGLIAPTLVSSRDLRNWNRLSREPFIRQSPLSDARCFDHARVYASPPVRHGNELWFYYFGVRYSHVGQAVMKTLKPSPNEAHTAIFLARLRVDGFASLEADETPGHLLSKPLRVSGYRLFLNADAAAGELKVELRDARTGRGIPGFCMGDYLGSRILESDDGSRRRLRIGAGARFEDDPEGDETVPVTTDGTEIEVRWKSGADLTALEGREVRVFMQLRNAKLYAFWFA